MRLRRRLEPDFALIKFLQFERKSQDETVTEKPFFNYYCEIPEIKFVGCQTFQLLKNIRCVLPYTVCCSLRNSIQSPVSINKFSVSFTQNLSTILLNYLFHC